MSRVVAWPTPSGKFNYIVIGDDVQEQTLAFIGQGFASKQGLENNREALTKALQEAGPTEYVSRAAIESLKRRQRKLVPRKRK